MSSELDQFEVHSCYMLKYMTDLPVDLLFFLGMIFFKVIFITNFTKTIAIKVSKNASIINIFNVLLLDGNGISTIIHFDRSSKDNNNGSILNVIISLCV